MAVDIHGIAPLLQVFDMPVSVHFYRDVLGFDLVQTSPKLSENADDVNWAMLQLNGATLMLNTAYEPEHRPAAPDPARIAMHSDAALYFGCPDVDKAYRELRAMGIEVKEPAVAPYGMKQLYLKDPDGYELCFQWKAYDSCDPPIASRSHEGLGARFRRGRRRGPAMQNSLCSGIPATHSRLTEQPREG